jgi:hypothetical protein
MRSTRFRCVEALLVGLVWGQIASAQTAPVVAIDRVMTQADMRATGVAGLNTVQRAALDRWLSEYTLNIFKVVQKSDAGVRASAGSVGGAYVGSSGGHWIQSTSNSGSIIVLEDGSMWEINAIDRIDTALWLPITDITVLKANSPVGEYKYVLVNKDDGEKLWPSTLARNKAAFQFNASVCGS